MAAALSIGVVTGLAREAEIARAAGLAVRCEGPGPDAARRAALALADAGAALLVSFGYAGGLDPGVPAGTLLLPARVVDGAGREWPCVARLDPPAGTLIGTDRPVTDAGSKRRLAATAMAVDCESHAVAAVAQARGLSFCVVRAVVDDGGTGLPGAALAGVDAQGRVRMAVLMRALMLSPRDLPAVIRLAAAARRADRSLGRAAGRLAAA